MGARWRLVGMRRRKASASRRWPSAQCACSTDRLADRPTGTWVGGWVGGWVGRSLLGLGWLRRRGQQQISAAQRNHLPRTPTATNPLLHARPPSHLPLPHARNQAPGLVWIRSQRARPQRAVKQGGAVVGMPRGCRVILSCCCCCAGGGDGAFAAAKELHTGAALAGVEQPQHLGVSLLRQRSTHLAAQLQSRRALLSGNVGQGCWPRPLPLLLLERPPLLLCRRRAGSGGSGWRQSGRLLPGSIGARRKAAQSLPQRLPGPGGASGAVACCCRLGAGPSAHKGCQGLHNRRFLS